MDKEQLRKAYGKIVAKAWADDAFKQRLLSDSTAMLKENGVDVPEGLEFRVMESTSNLIYLVLPQKPDPEELSTQDLEMRLAAYTTTIV